VVRDARLKAWSRVARFEGYAGRYVWHWHNLEHEDSETMRPYEVVADAPGSSS
jgi:hypothetical protein